MVAWLRLLICLALVGPSTIAYGQPAPTTSYGITPDVVRLVKQATVLIDVQLHNGQKAEGSGFLVIRSDIIVTNAHVLGMLRPSGSPPTKIEAIVNSGAANELKLSAALVGVDRANDIAVLKVQGTLPPALQLANPDELVETQKVYIFGFPFGSELGRNVTVSESAISSLRSNTRGELQQIQVNGGMHPGNSGGPVVDTQGRVIGMAVAVIRGTQINFAIPAGTVKSVLAGRILDLMAGEVYRDGSTSKVPVEYKCIDPFQRIRDFRVEVWAGHAAENRDYSPKEAQTQPGDGLRQTHVLKYQGDTASGDVVLPKLAAGQVAWVQPVASFTSGAPLWGQPQSFDANNAVQKVAANLAVKLRDQKERTVHLKSGQSLTINKGRSKLVLAQKAELDLLEAFSEDPKGALITIGFGPPRLTVEEEGKTAALTPEIANIVQRVPPRFVIDETNKLRQRTDTNLNPRLSPGTRNDCNDYLALICNGYEAATFVIPNRTVQPRENWPVKMPLLLKTGAKPEFVDLAITCTYEGKRDKAGLSEALISFEGSVQGRGAEKDTYDGRVAGKFTLDLERGFISWVKMNISSEVSSAAGDTSVVFGFDSELTRVEGNAANITLPSPGSPSASAPSAGTASPSFPATAPSRPPIAKSPARKPTTSVSRNQAAGDFPFKGIFPKPAASPSPTSYMKVVSQPGDYIGGGKSYDYSADQLNIRITNRGLAIGVDGWRLEIGAPQNLFIKVGEYPDAKRFAFSGDAPGLDFSGKGRGSNKLTGAFVIWELEIKGDQVTKLAVDFEQHSEGKAEGLTGKIRINSSLE